MDTDQVTPNADEVTLNAADTNPFKRIHRLREDAFTKCYQSALIALEEQVKLHPLQASYNIYEGCVSIEVMNYISEKFIQNGITSKPSTWDGRHFLTVKISV